MINTIILEHQSIKRQYPKNQKLQFEICFEIGHDLKFCNKIVLFKI